MTAKENFICSALNVVCAVIAGFMGYPWLSGWCAAMAGWCFVDGARELEKATQEPTVTK